MKFYEKYLQLQQKSFLKETITDTVFATMVLENQEVPKSKIVKIVNTLLEKRVLEGTQFFTN